MVFTLSLLAAKKIIAVLLSYEENSSVRYTTFYPVHFAICIASAGYSAD